MRRTRQPRVPGYSNATAHIVEAEEPKAFRAAITSDRGDVSGPHGPADKISCHWDRAAREKRAGSGNDMVDRTPALRKAGTRIRELRVVANHYVDSAVGSMQRNPLCLQRGLS